MLIVFSKIIVLFAFISFGFIFTKLKKITPEHVKILSSLLVNLFLPFMVFKSFSRDFTVEYIKGKYPLLIACTVIVVVIYIISVFIARLFENKNKYNRDIYIYTFTVPNFGAVGYALAAALPVMISGEMVSGGYKSDVIVFSIPLCVFTYTVGISLLTKTKLNLKGLLNPIIFAMVLGSIFGLGGFSFPTFEVAGVDVDIISDILTHGENCVAPLGMMIVGITIAEYKFSDILGNLKIYIASLLRLIVIPLALGGVITILINFGIVGKDVLFCTLCCYAMPCGMNTVVFPKLISEDCRIGAGTAVISNSLCIITIPIIFHIFGLM